MLTGPFYFRTLFGHAPMSLKTTSEVVDAYRVIRPNTEVGAVRFECALWMPSRMVLP